MKKRLFLFKISFSIIAISSISYIALRQYYTRYMPTQPEGVRTIAIDANYLKTVYVSAREDSVFTYLGILMLVGLVIGVIALIPYPDRRD